MIRLIIYFVICCRLASALTTGLTYKEQRIILKEHNRDRSKDASHGAKSASNLRKMVRFVFVL
jgi:hypothetical protein